MPRLPVVLIVLAVCVASAVASAAQSLGDVARREAARRKAIATPARLYTNLTLGLDPAPAPGTGPRAGQPAAAAQPAADAPSAPSVAQAQAASAVPASVAAAPTAPAAPTRGALTEAEWRTRLAEARAAVSRAELMREALQSRINALDTDFINRDDPVQRDGIQLNRQRAQAEFERTGREIRTLQTRVSDLQEEARRAGVPPGWLR
jgi:hypothetical protein